jgi:hypothetical protein
VRIVIKRTGGYGGAGHTATVDTLRLDPGRARQIEQLADQASAGAAQRTEPVGADLLRYDIKIQDGGKTRTLSFIDDGSPDAGPMKRLVEEISELSVD